jgi:MFS family permease
LLAIKLIAIMSSSLASQEPVDPRHATLRAHPVVWASIGVIQTLLTAGIVFGYASLLPVLRDEGVKNSPQDFSRVFTYGAVGNYISTLLFGTILDKFGPKTTGMVSSALFALGLVLCRVTHNFLCITVGFALLGFAGPGIQLPTLHLANLFSEGAAFFMSAQAAAFDGGTAVFCILRLLHQNFGLPSSTFFLLYLIVPAWVFLTSALVWPREILHNQNAVLDQEYVGAGSPYLSPGKPRLRHTSSLQNAPLSTILFHPAFYILATWVSVHILKLNFVVATLNDQLLGNVEQDQAERLIGTFGAMLPFGFLALPIVATLLEKSALHALQLANLVGFLYGGVLVYFPGNVWLMSLIVFPSVATSRQLVYSTVFHQIGQLFGFSNYGVLLGLTNVCVSAFSIIQTPLVDWSETVDSYMWSNAVLWLLTVPLFFSVLFSEEKVEAKRIPMNESTPLLSEKEVQQFREQQEQQRRKRSNSTAV